MADPLYVPRKMLEKDVVVTLALPGCATMAPVKNENGTTSIYPITSMVGGKLLEISETAVIMRLTEPSAFGPPGEVVIAKSAIAAVNAVASVAIASGADQNLILRR